MSDTHSPLDQAIISCRPKIFGLIIFSFFINLLMMAVPLYSLQVLDRVLNSGSHDTLLFLSLIVVVCLLFMSFLQAMRNFVFSHTSRWIDDQIAQEVAEKTVYLATYKPHISSQPLRDLNTIRGFITSQSLISLFDAPWAILFFIAIYMINPILGLAVTLGAAVLLILAYTAYHLPKKAGEEANEANIKSTQIFDIMIRNAEIVKAMGLGARATQNWKALHQKSVDLNFSSSNINTTISNITKAFRIGLQIMVTGLGAYLTLEGSMSAGSMIAASILAGKALQPFDAAISIYQGLISTSKAKQRIDELFDAVDSVSADKIILPEPLGRIKAENLSYQDKATGRILLKQVSFECEPGEIVGVIGPSGSGKTTLARLLCGVLSPSSGSVRLDGSSLSNWDDQQMSAYMGYLPQNVELFSGSVKENIARLDPDAKDEDVIKAAEKAGVHDFIKRLPNGYQTDIGVNGSLLSAGQKQRIGLARCFYGPVKYVLLDEPNSNLDAEGEGALVSCLQKARKEQITTFLIAHRPAIMQVVDKIIVIQDGQLVMFGPRDEIMLKLMPKSSNISPMNRPHNSQNMSSAS